MSTRLASPAPLRLLRSLLATALIAVPALADDPAQSPPAAAPPPAPPVTAEAATEAPSPAEPEPAPAEQPATSFFDATTVTATGAERDVFELATPVTVLDATRIERLDADNPAELLREQPGVDVNGVGPNQARPVIRGQRGLRVLFLEDGLRLNNARRQSDFGEITGMVDLEGISAVEVVRGPASVLYGSDAIGGVLNLVPKRPTFGAGETWSGYVEGGYADAADGGRAAAGVAARFGRVDAQLGATRRDSDDYEAPAGTFGDIHLDHDVPVLDTGLEDDSLWANLVYGLADGHYLRLRGQRYRADQSGFGLVEPAEYDPAADSRVRIFYPYQDFDRWTLAYEGSALGFAVADTLDAKAYWQSNERELANDIDIDIGPLAPAPGWPHSSVEADTTNFTDVDTWGLRLEAIKGIGDRHLVTWGVEGFSDDSVNSDFSVTTTILRFPFPPFEMRFVDTDDVANAPNAKNDSLGVFVQDEVALGARVRLTGGLRWQQVETSARSTPGWDTAGLDFDDQEVVGALTGTWQITEELNALASYGTAFRAPSIVERLFNGITPEGFGYQVLNPDLVSESSDNIDLGIKYRRRDAFLEAVVFRTEIEDGIVLYFLSDEEIAALPPEIQAEIEASGVDFVAQQRNAERLRYEGVEIALGYRAPFGLTVGGNFSYIDGKRLDSFGPPTGDNYGEKYIAYLRYEPDSGRYWAEYRVRHNGSTAANLDPNEPVPPVGTTLPSFTVHTLAGGVTLFETAATRHGLQLTIENLTDELYAEFSNATFFRPEPGRDVRVTYRLRF